VVKKVGKFLYWTPRIVSIMFILFLMLFSLDVFEGNYGFWGTILGLFMHNIPALCLFITLLIAWKHEWVGGFVFTLGGVLYIILSINRVQGYLALAWSLQIAGPAFIIAGLFFANWLLKKKTNSIKQSKS